MNPEKKFFVIFLAIVFITWAGLAGVGYAQEKYPRRAIEIIVPYAPGGATDLVARVIAISLNKRWGVPVQVVNKPGGNTLPACLEFYRAAPDGYTMLAENQATSSMLEIVVKDLPFKIMDRTFIATMAITPMILIVPSASSYKSLTDIIQEAKKDPQNFTWTSIGGAAPQDFTIRQFFKAIDVDVLKTKPVMVQGASQAVSLTAGGHVKLGCGATSSAIPGIQGGNARPLGITGKSRFPELPDVPTMEELGFPSVSCRYWVGISGPPKMPEPISTTWDKALRELIKDPDFVALLKKIKALPLYRDARETQEFVSQENLEVSRLWKLKD